MRHYFASSVFLLSCIAAGGDVLVLKGGNYRIEGTITESGDGYVITTPTGEVMSFPKGVIASIIRKPSSETAPNASAKQTVVLKDGRRYTGEVNGNNRPNDYLIFTADGFVQIVPKADVVRIIGSAPSYPEGNPAPVPRPPAPNAVARPASTPLAAPLAPSTPAAPARGTTLAAVAVPATPSELASTIHFRVQKTVVLEKNLTALKGGPVVVISPDLSRCVLRGKHYGSVDMVDLDTRQVIPFTTMFNRNWRFAFSPDSKFLAGAGITLTDSKDKVVTIRLWDTQTGRELAVLDKMPDMVLSDSGNVVNGITFDRTSSYVAITGYWSAGRATDPSFIKIYSVGGQYRKLHDLKLEHGVAGNAPLVFSSDNKAIYVTGYPPSNKPELHRVSLVAPNSALDVVWDTDKDATAFASGAPLAVVRRRNREEVFNLEKKLVIGTFGTSYEVETMAFSPDNRSLCVGTDGHANLPNHLAVWDVIERKRISVLPESEEFCRSGTLRFSTDGRRIAASESGRICIWEMTTAPVAEPPASQLTVKETRTLPEGYPVAVSRDFSRCLLARSRPEQTVLCDTSTGRELAAFDGTWKFQFSPDSKYLGGCGGTKDELYIRHTNTIRLWDTRTGQEVVTLERMPVDTNSSSDDIYHSPVFDRAGNLLAAVRCGSLKLFSVAGNNFRKILDRSLSRQEGQPLQAMFAPDGRSVYLRFDPGSGPHIIRRAALVEGAAPTEYASAIDRSSTLAFCRAVPLNVRMNGKMIEVWDLEKKSSVGKIDSVCYSDLLDVSPDDRLICAHAVDTGSAAAGLTLWNLTDLNRLVTVNIPRPKLIVFSADSRRLAAVSERLMRVFEISQSASSQAPAVVAAASSTNAPPTMLTANDSQSRLRLVNVRELMPAPGSFPTWSCRPMPDGKTLLYLALERRNAGAYQLKLRDLATGVEKPLPLPAFRDNVESCQVLAANCVTPDGKTIVVYTGVDANNDGVIHDDEKRSIALYDVASSTVRALNVQDDSVFATLDTTGKMLFVGATKRNSPFSTTRKIYSTLLSNIDLRPLAIGGGIYRPCPTATLLPICHPVLWSDPKGALARDGRTLLYDYYSGKLFTGMTWTGNAIGQWTSNGCYFYTQTEDSHETYCWDRVRGKSVRQIENKGLAIGPGPTSSSMVVQHSGGIALHDAEKGTMVRVGEHGMEPISAFGRTLIYRTSGYNPTICMAEIEMPAGSAKP